MSSAEHTHGHEHAPHSAGVNDHSMHDMNAHGGHGRATASPRRGLVPSAKYRPPRQSGSAITAWRPTS